MYYNRDISWLEFNYCVLQEASCDKVPLFERLKFLSIFYSNLDEFFSIRYPVILAISRLKEKARTKILGEMPEHTLEEIQAQVGRHLAEAGSILEHQLLPALEENGIVLYYDQPLKRVHIAEVREIFLSKVLSFIQPVFLDDSVLKKFAPEANKLYLVISLRKHGAEEVRQAIIKVPSDSLKRFYSLSPVNGKNYVIFIEDIIRDNVQFVFPGFEIAGVYSIMMNRNAELDYEEDYPGNILKKIEKQLVKRAQGLPSRFLCEPSMPSNLRLYVASVFGIGPDEHFTGLRYHSLRDISTIPTFGKLLTYEEQRPILQQTLIEGGEIFKPIDEKDILLHFPYHSYNPILIFFNQAAIDPEVEEIYITLYRVATGSLIANALISAAKNGKRVTVFIELKARFDEANNILWSRKMKDAGIKLIYSIPGIKVHTKIALVTKQTNGERKAYALISTGNFNELTARLYTDHTLLTSDTAVTEDLLILFRFLEKRELPAEQKLVPFSRLLVSQFNMVHVFNGLIEKEIEKVKNGGRGLVRIKMNNLEERGMIDVLYNAGRAGVEVRLIVRSICCIVPGVPGSSDNIKVRRVVDRYLEHTRVFIFGANDDAEVIIGSSDWMTRNLYHRIEACTPVKDAECRQQLLDYFELQWREDEQDTKCGDAGVDCSHVHEHVAQRSIYEYLKERS